MFSAIKLLDGNFLVQVPKGVLGLKGEGSKILILSEKLYTLKISDRKRWNLARSNKKKIFQKAFSRSKVKALYETEALRIQQSKQVSVPTLGQLFNFPLLTPGIGAQPAV